MSGKARLAMSVWVLKGGFVFDPEELRPGNRAPPLPLDGLRERDHRQRAVRAGAAVGVAVRSRALLTCAAS